MSFPKPYIVSVYLCDENGNGIRRVLFQQGAVSAQEAVEMIRADYLRDTDEIEQVYELTTQPWNQGYNKELEKMADSFVEECPYTYFHQLHLFSPDGTTRYIPESILSPKVKLNGQDVEDVYPEYFKSHPLPKLD